jgi:hypothetical protein
MSFSVFILSDSALLDEFNSCSIEEQEAIRQVRWVQATREWVAKYPMISLENVRQAFIEYV